VEPIEIRSSAGRKQAIYFGAKGRPLFGFYHPPPEGLWRGVGVVLCRPIGTDQTRSDRVYRHLAERLAAAGFASLRFDLFGTGDSGGDELSPGLVRAWLDDVGLAIDELRARSGAKIITLAGLRLGATLALLQAAERGDVDSLVLWSPWVTGAAFVAEVTKLHQLFLRMEPQMAEAFPTRAGCEEALGLLLPRAVIDDLSRIDFLKTMRRPARRTLFIDGGNVQQRDEMMAHLRELGAAPELRSHPGHKFLITISQRSLVPDEVLDSIVGWLKDLYPSTVAQEALAPRPFFQAPLDERPFRLGKRHPLFGIFTPADPAHARPDRPGILILNAASVNRAGPHRLNVKMARRWAQLGFDVLRLDLSGIGDSPVAPGASENLTYPPSGLDDISEASDAFGSRRAIVIGLCSGGDYAFQVGARDPRVAGAGILNPRTFCVLDLAAVDSADSAPPTTPVEDVPRTLRRMAERGVDTLLLVSPKDPGVSYVDLHAPDAMRALAAVPGFQRIDLPATDHTFTPITAQDRVIDLVGDHLLARH
jgi:alpha-beta hydrolase superfamily lysophospholipase